jgi:hypothetical protein
MSLLEPPAEILSLLRETIPTAANAADGDEDTGSADILSYVAFLAAGLCEVQDFTPATWTDVLKPYLDGIQGGNGDSEECLNTFREAAAKVTCGEDDADSYGDDDDDGFEEVCNLRFK